MSEFDNLCIVDDCVSVRADVSSYCEKHRDDAKKRVIEGFRVYLAAKGIRGYLLSDDEAWQWIENIIESMNRHVAMRAQSREVLGSLPPILHPE